jgi:hypothetical protein
MSNPAQSAVPPTAPATPERYPVVEFEYPTSEDGKMKLRYLRLVSADADHIKGYELDFPGSQKDGQFKSFSRNRLVRQAPTLVSF